MFDSIKRWFAGEPVAEAPATEPQPPAKAPPDDPPTVAAKPQRFSVEFDEEAGQWAVRDQLSGHPVAYVDSIDSAVDLAARKNKGD